MQANVNKPSPHTYPSCQPDPVAVKERPFLPGESPAAYRRRVNGRL